MKKLSLCLVVALALLLSSCHKDPATLQIRFQPKWGADDLKLNTVYQTPDGYMKFSNLDMYLSHIRLIRNDNSEVEVDSAVLLLYRNNAFTINLNAVKGDYKGIKFSIGLDSVQNAIRPDSVPESDPVYYDNTLYWIMNREHLFIQMAGLSGTSSSLGSVFLYHIGFDSYYHTTSVTKSFSVTDGNNTTLNLTADLQQVFTGTNAVNVINEPLTHTNDFPAIATKVMNNFAASFSLQ